MKIFKNRNFLILFFFVIIITLSNILPLSGDEAYYWNCSKHIDWAYFDQPPLVIWLSGIFSFIYKSNFTVRLPSIIFTFLTFILLKKWLKEKGVLFFLVTSTFPLIFFGSFYLSTDRALTFFYLLETYLLTKINEKNSNILWLFLGIAFGLGFLSKFPMVLILPIIFYFFYKKANIFQFILFTVSSIPFILPVLVYGFENNWANFIFQLFERHKENPSFLNMIKNLWLPNLILIGPTFFIKGLYEMFKNYKKDLILFFSGLIPLVFFTICGFKNPGAPHWLSLSVYSISILQIDRWGKKSLKISIFINLAIILIFLIVLFFPQFFFKISPSNFKNFVSFDILKEKIIKEKRGNEILISPSYTIVSLLNYYFDGKDIVYLYNLNRGVHGLSFLFWQKNLKFESDNYLLISNRKFDKKNLERYFEHIEERIIKVDKRKIEKKYYIYHCKIIKNKEPFYFYGISN